MMLTRGQRGLLLSGLALLLVLPAMLLVASYFKMVEMGAEATAAQIAMDKVNYAGRDIERIVKYMVRTGQPFDNITLQELADNYRAATGLLVQVSGIDTDNDNAIDSTTISVQDPRSAARYFTTIEFKKLSVMIFPDMAVYRPGDNVTLTVYVGNVYGMPQSGATVNLTVIDSSGENIYFASGLTDNEGSWENSFILSTTAKLGQYLVIADAAKDFRTGSNTTTFEVKHDILIQIIEPDKDTYSPGENENVVVRLTDETGSTIVGAYVKFEVLDNSYLSVDGPVVMYDDGQHFDGGANDGIYGESRLLPSLAGDYYVRVYAGGIGYSDNFADRSISIA
jgi:5-hydroxyisourate hydrolase-like protein (transthyretin family)